MKSIHFLSEKARKGLRSERFLYIFLVTKERLPIHIKERKAEQKELRIKSYSLNLN